MNEYLCKDQNFCQIVVDNTASQECQTTRLTSRTNSTHYKFDQLAPREFLYFNICTL
jgi:hypothetical protein